MDFFLRLKHWQLFLISIGVYFIARLTSVFLVFVYEVGFGIIRILFAIGAMSFVVSALWMYSVVINLRKRLPSDAVINIYTFKECIYFVVLYQALFQIIFRFFDYSHVFVWIASWISFICFIYVCSVASNVLVTVERQARVSFRNSFVEFFAFFFYPIGLWWLQPRINKISESGFSRS